MEKNLSSLLWAKVRYYAAQDRFDLLGLPTSHSRLFCCVPIRLCFGGHFHGWDFDGKSCTFIHLAFYRHPAMMLGNNAIGDR